MAKRKKRDEDESERKENFPGVAGRIRERLQDLGYWKDGRPDVLRFCQERGYLPTYVYKWINKAVVPDYTNLQRLALDLDCALAWLLLGEHPAPGTPPKKRGNNKQRGAPR